MTYIKFGVALSCLLFWGCAEMDLSDPAVVDSVSTEGILPADELAAPDDQGAHTEDVRSVCAASLTIRNSPGGATLGTLNQWDRFSIESYYDGVWYLGTGYRWQNGYYVARGFVLAQYLC